ncbi:MAG TPA: hypothetical protein VEM96_10315 [Pyrinomonadaceae bacterium]|nr:hypothetical protein [Pyrinomonadaceae bacterium]
MNTLYRRLFLFIAILLSCVITQAQSGRRSTSSPTTSPSVSGPKPLEKTPAKVPRIHLLVGVENRNPLTNIPYYLSDTVLDNCVRHLADSADVVPNAVGRGMDRVDAVRRAKAEKEDYVVWLQIEGDVLDSGKQQKNGPDELYVRYTIFEPVTAKVRQSGRTHQQIYKTGRGGVSTSTKNSPVYSEYALKQAAREAAERILEAFEIRVRDESLLR